MRSIARKLVLVAWIGVLVASFVGCATVQKVRETEEAVGGVEEASEKRLSITVDPRIELLAVVQHFTPWAAVGHIKSNTIYEDDVEHYFGEFKDHPVVAYAQSLMYANFTHDAPVQFMLSHGDPPELVQKSPYSDYLIERARGSGILLVRQTLCGSTRLISLCMTFMWRRWAHYLNGKTTFRPLKIFMVNREIAIMLSSHLYL